MILVTGAAGHLGTDVIEHLLTLTPADTIAGLQRRANQPASWQQKGVQMRIGDYANKPSIMAALAGVDKVLLVTSNSENAFLEHKNVIDAATEVDVKHIYYTGGALNTDVAQSQLGPLTDSYIKTERYIIDSGLPYTVFQNGLYAEVIPDFIGKDVLETGIYFPAGEGKASFTKRIEMGEAIANVLASEGHANKIYLITSLPTYSFTDIAQLLSELAGKDVPYHSPSPEDYANQLREYGISEGDIQLSSLFGALIKNDEYDVVGSDLVQILGRKPTDLRTYLEETFLR